MDGLRFSDDKVRAGICFGQGEIKYTECQEEQFHIVLEADGKEVRLVMTEQSITIKGQSLLVLSMEWKEDCFDVLQTDEKSIRYCHNGFGYELELESGRFEEDTGTKRKIVSDAENIVLAVRKRGLRY